jgi:hypothetical protein
MQPKKQEKLNHNSKNTISNVEMVKKVMTKNVIQQVPTIDIIQTPSWKETRMIPSMNHHQLSHLPSQLRLDHSIIKSSSTTIQIPHEHDVLLGRGGRNNQWTGNEILRHAAFELSNQYRTAKKTRKTIHCVGTGSKNTSFSTQRKVRLWCQCV